MFAWFWSLFARSRDDIYHPRERNVFTYFNGTRRVRVDPLVLWNQIMAVGPSLSIDLKVARSASKDAAKADTNAVATIRKLFGIAPLVGGLELPPEGSLTGQECCELLDAFLVYCERAKKKWNKPATSVAETSPATPSSSADVPATELSSDSTSTASVSNSVPAEPLPSV